MTIEVCGRSINTETNNLSVFFWRKRVFFFEERGVAVDFWVKARFCLTITRRDTGSRWFTYRTKTNEFIETRVREEKENKKTPVEIILQIWPTLWM
jgi:hypothetical protein